MLKNIRRRRQKGQSMVVLIVFLLVFFILLLGMAGFEFARYSLCCQEFQHCVDIAALGGAAGLASSQTTNQSAAQTTAINTAQWMMEQNYILDKSLNGMTTWSSGTSIPTKPLTANRANMCFTWLDPETNQPTAVAGDQKVFRVSGCYAYPPLVGSWIGLGNNALGAVTAIGDGGGIMLDVALCFDLSGSIDDSTQTTFIDRYKNGASNVYRIVRQTGTLYSNLGCTSDTGSGINCCYPQMLGSDNSATFVQSRRGSTQAAPPMTSAGSGNQYTDIVVNLDENQNFGGFTSNLHGTTFSFPNVGTLCEAARGNLESITLANAANVNYGALGITPQSGYYREYWEQALMHRHPLYDAQQSAAHFFQVMNNSVNAHFSLEAFNTDENVSNNENAVNNGTQQHSLSIASPGPIPTGATVTCKVPYVPLDNTPGAAGSNFTTISNWFPPNNPPNSPQLTASDSTDINGSLYLALQQFLPSSKISGGLNKQRQGAKTAVIMFTDGRPTANSAPGDMNGVATTAIASANAVQIYCIGLAQIPAIVAPMTAVLQPMATNTGGKLYIIPPGSGQAAALDRAFSDIARSLIALTR